MVDIGFSFPELIFGGVEKIEVDSVRSLDVYRVRGLSDNSVGFLGLAVGVLICR